MTRPRPLHRHRAARNAANRFAAARLAAGLAAAALAAPAGSAHAADADASAPSPHVALVIGNARYPGLPPLPRCSASAQTVVRALRQAGFDVMALQDASNGEIGANLAGLRARLRIAGGTQPAPGATAVVYACGYAGAFVDRSFLIPADASIEQPADLLAQGILLSRLRSEPNAAGAAHSLVLLDLTPQPNQGTLPGVAGLAHDTQDPGAGLVAAVGAVPAPSSAGDSGPTVLARAAATALATTGTDTNAAVAAIRTALGPAANNMVIAAPTGVDAAPAQARSDQAPAAEASTPTSTADPGAPGNSEASPEPTSGPGAAPTSPNATTPPNAAATAASSSPDGLPGQDATGADTRTGLNPPHDTAPDQIAGRTVDDAPAAATSPNASASSKGPDTVVTRGSSATEPMPEGASGAAPTAAGSTPNAGLSPRPPEQTDATTAAAPPAASTPADETTRDQQAAARPDASGNGLNPQREAAPDRVAGATAEPQPDTATIDGRRRVQAALLRLGYYPGPVDGVFGTDTQAAIRRLQHELGADQSGRITPSQITRLLALAR